MILTHQHLLRAILIAFVSSACVSCFASHKYLDYSLASSFLALACAGTVYVTIPEWFLRMDAEIQRRQATERVCRRIIGKVRDAMVCATVTSTYMNEEDSKVIWLHVPDKVRESVAMDLGVTLVYMDHVPSKTAGGTKLCWKVELVRRPLFSVLFG